MQRALCGASRDGFLLCLRCASAPPTSYLCRNESVVRRNLNTLTATRHRDKDSWFLMRNVETGAFFFSPTYCRMYSSANLISVRRGARNSSIKHSSSSGADSRSSPGGMDDDDSGNENNDSGDSSDDGSDSSVLNVIHNETMANMQAPSSLPDVPIIPLTRYPLFPKFIKYMEIKDNQLIQLLKKKIKINMPYAGAFLRKDDSVADTITSLSEVYPVGTFIQITGFQESSNGMRMVLSGHRRIKIVGLPDNPEQQSSDNGGIVTASSGPLLTVRTENYETEKFRNTPEIRSLSAEVVKCIRELVSYNSLFKENLSQLLELGRAILDDHGHVADFGTVLCTADAPELQAVLEERNVERRLILALELLKKELAICALQKKLAQEVEDKVVKAQRKYLLQEQMKIIKRELGLEKDDKDTIIEKYKDRIKDKTIPDSVKSVIDEEIGRLSFLDPHSSEFNVARNYLDWLTCIPWGVTSEENKTLENARKVLDEDHYGLGDIKDRIMEFIAVSQLTSNVQGKILCFVGPPGVGKTSIGKSIARALNRKYYRFSVGGLEDVAEIKGHRRTYVGAMPGKVIQCLKKVMTENPLILIDEVDKLGQSHRGDPASALLELLDPEQNHAFVDHYLDVPVNLSKVLFICTANVLERIPEPLRDRMEIIKIAGYVDDEKKNIADKYLVPVARKNNGVTDEKLIVDAECIDLLIKNYCRENGVRNLQKHIEKICRKAAFKLVNGEVPVVMVSSHNLQEYVGSPVFDSERIYDSTPVGVATGLAWTRLGGSSLFVETVVRGKGDVTKDSGRGATLEITGQLGSVMKDSCSIALTYAANFLNGLDPNNVLLQKSNIHLHVPEGATPKDGPSAGCTIVTALLSLASARPIKPHLAMTGEISLTGKILPVGGIKEKLIAARRSGIREVILPEGNKKDVAELQKFITEGLIIHFVGAYDEIYKIAFP